MSIYTRDILTIVFVFILEIYLQLDEYFNLTKQICTTIRKICFRIRVIIILILILIAEDI